MLLAIAFDVLAATVPLPQDPPPAAEPPSAAAETPAWRRTRLERKPAAELRTLWTKDLAAPSFGAACAADVDGDGKLELAFGTYFGDSRAIVLHGRDGGELWTHDFGGGRGGACLDASFRFAERDGELLLLVPVSNGCALHAMRARNGEHVWKYDTGAGDCIDSPPALAAGKDGIEVVFGSFQKRLHRVSLQTGKLVGHVRVGDGFVQSGPLVLDADGDGTDDYIAATFKGDNRLYCRSGKDGAELWHVQVARGGPVDLGIYHGPALGDLDGDGAPELVLTAYDGRVRCLRLRDGAERWVVEPGDRYFMGPPAIGDVDGDGKPEVVAASQRVTVMRGDGSVLYSVPIAPKGGWVAADRGPALADLDGDGKLDIAVLRADGWFGVVRGTTGELVYELPAAKVTPRPVMSCAHGPLLADLDGDGRLDAFYVIGSATEKARFGVAVCVTGFAGTGPGWYMLRHDPSNTGNAATPLPAWWQRRIEKSR